MAFLQQPGQQSGGFQSSLGNIRRFRPQQGIGRQMMAGGRGFGAASSQSRMPQPLSFQPTPNRPQPPTWPPGGGSGQPGGLFIGPPFHTQGGARRWKYPWQHRPGMMPGQPGLMPLKFAVKRRGGQSPGGLSFGGQQQQFNPMFVDMSSGQFAGGGPVMQTPPQSPGYGGGQLGWPNQPGHIGPWFAPQGGGQGNIASPNLTSPPGWQGGQPVGNDMIQPGDPRWPGGQGRIASPNLSPPKPRRRMVDNPWGLPGQVPFEQSLRM